jgi:hypothetical protein
MCEAGCTAQGMLDSLVRETVSFNPKSRTFGNRLVVVLARAPYRVFRSTLKGLNQSIRLLTVI